MRILTLSLCVLLLTSPALAVAPSQNSARGGVVLRADAPMGAVLEPGDRISFECQSATEATLIAFDIDTQGYVHLLHPTGELDLVSARQTLPVPGDGSELIIEGEPGVEFVFALSVGDASAVDMVALESLRNEMPPRRIEGDPFIAANMIAADLVKDISQREVYFGYTWFYVSERVDHPCYLCGECDGELSSAPCEGQIVQNFDRRAAMSYPLRRGYEVVEVASTEEPSAPPAGLDNDDDVVVNFYPYGSEVRYADPMAVNLWYDWGWYDPYWYYPPYYPYCGWGWPGWSVSIGFGWGWGWGGYYCSGWYDPWYGYGYPYYPDYPDYPYYPSDPPERFKSKYKSEYSDGASSTLAANRVRASKQDADLRVASNAVKPANARTATVRSKPSTTRASSAYSSRRVKTSVSGGTRNVVRETWRSGTAAGRGAPGTTGYRTKGTSSTSGRSVIQRGSGTRTRSNAVSPAPRSSGRSSGQMRAPSSHNAPRSSGVYRGGAASRGGGGGTKSAPRGRGK